MGIPLVLRAWLMQHSMQHFGATQWRLLHQGAIDIPLHWTKIRYFTVI
jgi:hypothetical protein